MSARTAPGEAIIISTFRENYVVFIITSGPIIFPVLLHIITTLYLLTNPAFLLAFSQLGHAELLTWESSLA
jgi:hypothetical protein